jgi:hypothetical protein
MEGIYILKSAEDHIKQKNLNFNIFVFTII